MDMADDLTLKGSVIEAVSQVIDPVGNRSILDAHMLDAVDVVDGKVDVRLSFSADYPRDARWQVEDAVADRAESVEGVRDVNVHGFVQGEQPLYGGGTPVGEAAGGPAADGAAKAPAGGGAAKAAGAGPEPATLKGVGRVIAVASGKGGVGKSTVAVNLALGLQRLGFRVGLLDVDVYGPSVPTLLGVHERPTVKNKRILPLEAHNLKLMSLGFLMEDDSPVIWRGPIVTGIIRQFLQDVDWEGTDYLIVDMPPGTGDAQLSLAQSVPVDGAVVVTTPSDLALIDAARGLRMFNTLNIEVLGIVENMAWYAWPGARELEAIADEVSGSDGALAARLRGLVERHGKAYIFGQGGGEREAARLQTRFLGHIPLDGTVRAAGDRGTPIVVAEPDSAVTDAFLDLARAVSEARPLPQAGGERKGFFSFVKK